MARLFEAALSNTLPFLSMKERGELLTAISLYQMTGERYDFKSVKPSLAFSTLVVLIDADQTDATESKVNELETKLDTIESKLNAIEEAKPAQSGKKRGNPNFIKKSENNEIAILRNSTQLSANSDNSNEIVNNCTELSGIGILPKSEENTEESLSSTSPSPTPPISDTLFQEETLENKEIEDKSSAKKAKKSLANLPERRQKFEERVRSYSADYPPETIEKFLSYWGEVNEGGYTMAWEKQETFDIGRRLARFNKPLPGRTVHQPTQPPAKVDANIQAVIEAQQIIRQKYGQQPGNY